jgi:hypothetical protein
MNIKKISLQFVLGTLVILSISVYVGGFLALHVIYSLIPDERPLDTPSAVLGVYQDELPDAQMFPSKVQLQPAVGVE